MTAYGVCGITKPEQLPAYMRNVERRIDSRGGSFQIGLTVADAAQAALLIGAYNEHFRHGEVVWLKLPADTYPFRLVAHITTRQGISAIEEAERTPLPDDEQDF